MFLSKAASFFVFLILSVSLAGCGTPRKATLATDLFYKTQEAARQSFGKATKIGAYTLRHSVPGQKSQKIALSIAPVRTLEEAKAAQRVIVQYIRMVCPRYSGAHGRYNSGFIAPVTARGDHAPSFRKASNEMIVVGACASFKRFGR
ncbi:MAG: hypothetical protein L3J67_01420 [Hyphomicrobiaceae bacterium]|nr:hypothetical protein [Hyphomicrobiaceae bacterium]